MSNTAELVFIPLPGMGHTPSAIQLAKLILQRNQLISVSIHVINLSGHVDETAYVESQSRDNPYPTRLTFVTYPPLLNRPDPSLSYTFDTIVQLHKPIVKQTVQDRVKAGNPKPVGFVVDMYCTAMLDVANELNVPCYAFIASGANLLDFQLYAQSLVDDYCVDITTKFSDPGFMGDVPGFKNPVPSKVFPAVLLEKGPICEMILDITRRLKKTKGILINTYVELESFAFQALLDNVGKSIPPVYPVGPIVRLDDKGCVRSDKESIIMEWLDRQPKSSVVFLCFGSLGIFGEEQVKEMADGLERSGYRFLWSLRKPKTQPPVGNKGTSSDNNNNDDTFLEALPKGFIDRTNDRGKIIGWAPQVAVLAHPAIGGFVCHAGWNTIFESLWFGVPIATWPMYAEEQLDAFMLVKELELAVDIRMDYNINLKTRKGNFLVTAQEIENGVKNLMSMDEKMRGRVKKMSEEGKKALKQGGSSYSYLGRFIEDVFNNFAQTSV